MRKQAAVLLVVLLPFASGFVLSTVAAAAPTTNNPFAETVGAPLLATKDVVSRVAVAGATGRTGKYVVNELLDRGVENVVAVVRDTMKAKEAFGDTPNLEIVQCDLSDEQQIKKVFQNVDAAIWCATGFSNAPSGIVEKVMQLFGMVVTPSRSIDVVGLPTIAKSLNATKDGLPKIIMCSSSGVTRTIWDDEKKERFRGAADIPIVRLNPFSILDRKRESEESLREVCQETGTGYCIVRPAGLNDEWPAGSRPFFSQGDVAVGRINRRDLATILVDVLSTPEATGKTFETIGVAGYPKQRSLGPALARLYKDSDAAKEAPDEDVLFATYAALQQLLPGERQDAAALAMGQTYEQLDNGETGRLGERGAEDAESAAPKPSS